MPHAHSQHNSRRVILIGDSTIQYNDPSTYPQTGWGQKLSEHLSFELPILNYAKNGMSSKSFITAGYYEPVLNTLSPNDLLLIQFGHNDQKDDLDRHTEPYGAYQQYLSTYVTDAKKTGAFPILITPLTRRRFNADGYIEACHGDYSHAVIQLAQKMNVPLIDLDRLSRDTLQSMGIERSKSLFMHLPANTYAAYPDGLIDNTHLTPLGASTFAKIVAQALNTLLSNEEENPKL